MGVSFYGNVKQNGQSTFIFDAIYSNRKEMEEKCQQDKVFVNRYVLVDYHYGKDENGNVISYDRYRNIPVNIVGYGDTLPTGTELDGYELDSFYRVDETVYYKVEKINDQEGNKWVKYSEVSESSDNINDITSINQLPNLKDAQPGSVYRLSTYHYYKLIEINSNKQWQEYYFSDNLTLQETDGYHNNKMTDVNTYGCTYDGTVWMKVYHNAIESYLLIGKFSDYSSPIFNFVELAPSDQLGMDIDYLHSSDLNYQVLYSKPWKIELDKKSVNSVGRINDTTAPGDDSETYSYEISEEQENNIKLIETNSGASYPVIDYKEIVLTKDSYEKNKYYIKKDINNNPQYIKAIEDFDSIEHYYIKTIINENEEKRADIKSLSLQLPALGNGAIYLYDGLFGKPAENVPPRLDDNGEPDGVPRPYTIDELKSLLKSTIGTNPPVALCLTSALELLKSAVNRWNSNTPQVDWIANYYRKITEDENSDIPEYEQRYKLEENGEYVEYPAESAYDFNNTYIIDKSFIQNRPKVIGEDAATILCQKIKLASTNFFYSTEES